MGFFDRLKAGLSKTREKIGRSFRSILPFGRKIDDAVISELEETMLADDMGPAVTARLIGEIRAAYKLGDIKETQDIVPFLESKIVTYWPEAARPLRFAESGPTVIPVGGLTGSGQTTT